jgi:hypothetical protein
MLITPGHSNIKQITNMTTKNAISNPLIITVQLSTEQDVILLTNSIVSICGK